MFFKGFIRESICEIRVGKYFLNTQNMLNRKEKKSWSSSKLKTSIH